MSTQMKQRLVADSNGIVGRTPANARMQPLSIDRLVEVGRLGGTPPARPSPEPHQEWREPVDRAIAELGSRSGRVAGKTSSAADLRLGLAAFEKI